MELSGGRIIIGASGGSGKTKRGLLIEWISARMK
jgi:hypothetical protein